MLVIIHILDNDCHKVKKSLNVLKNLISTIDYITLNAKTTFT